MLTENYSIFRPEVDEDQAGNLVARPNMKFFDHIFKFDRVIIAGQAKSHCVAWTVQDLHEEIKWRDPDFVHKIYLLKDCTSPVVVPGAVDFTDQADHAFREFARWGMHIVKSTDALIEWPGMSEM